MKTEFTDVSETQKTVTIEIDSSVVDAEIDRVAQGYKKVKIPGFRPGKVPATIIKRRFRNEILHEVMHGLIPRAVEEALQERGIEPIDTPNVRDVALEEDDRTYEGPIVARNSPPGRQVYRSAVIRSPPHTANSLRFAGRAMGEPPHQWEGSLAS